MQASQDNNFSPFVTEQKFLTEREFLIGIVLQAIQEAHAIGEDEHDEVRDDILAMRIEHQLEGLLRNKNRSVPIAELLADCSDLLETPDGKVFLNSLLENRITAGAIRDSSEKVRRTFTKSAFEAKVDTLAQTVARLFSDKTLPEHIEEAWELLETIVQDCEITDDNFNPIKINNFRDEGLPYGLNMSVAGYSGPSMRIERLYYQLKAVEGFIKIYELKDSIDSEQIEKDRVVYGAKGTPPVAPIIFRF